MMFKHSIKNNEQFIHKSSKGDLLGLASSQQSLIEDTYNRVMTAGYQYSHIEEGTDMERPPNCAFLAQCTTITVKRSYSGQVSYPPRTVAARVTNEEEVIMYRYRVSVDDVKTAASAKKDIGFANMDIRFLITDKNSGAQELSLFRTVFPPGFSAHQKHYHVDIEEVLFGIRGRGAVGMEFPDGRVEEFEVSPGVAIFIPKDCVHWFRNLDPKEEVEICGVYSAPDAGDYKPEDYKYLGEISEQDKKLR